MIGFVAEFSRQLIHRLAGGQVAGDTELAAAVERAAEQGSWSLESSAEACQRSLEAINHIDRNANQHTLVEAWLDELASLIGMQAVGGRR